MLDKLGKKIKIGNTVAYPVRRSSSCYLRFGTVEKLETRGIVVLRSNETEKLNYRHSKDVVKV